MEARTAPTAQGPPGMPCRLRKVTRQHGAPDIFPCPRSLPLSAPCEKIKTRNLNEMIRYDGKKWQY